VELVPTANEGPAQNRCSMIELAAWLQNIASITRRRGSTHDLAMHETLHQDTRHQLVRLQPNIPRSGSMLELPTIT
jgi:hypothetical protein